MSSSAAASRARQFQRIWQNLYCNHHAYYTRKGRYAMACHSRCFAELLRAARFSNRIVRLVGRRPIKCCTPQSILHAESARFVIDL